MRTLVTLLALTTVLALVLGSEQSSATLYCNRTYAELKKNPGRPYNAVGYLNNGCTATLIDANHILAAAHCFEDTGTGAWQVDLRFYPNFHPDRVAADAKKVPRADVTRAVVGSRAGEDPMGAGMDWGIARVDNWKDTAGVDLTPLALAASVPLAGMTLVNPSYTRAHFPFDDHDSVTWDNMERDKTNCAWVEPTHAVWALLMRPAPITDGAARRDMVGCNSRWGAGMIHADCSVTKVSGAVVIHNCDTIGGSSGSPLMNRDAGGKWSIVGVGHGGGTSLTSSANDFSLETPVCSADTANRRDNIGASVERFRDAPRFASNVAVHRSPYNAQATAVFAVDSDLNQVVWRIRQGNTPKYTSTFSFWQNIGAPFQGAKLTKLAACANDSKGTPLLFLVASGSIYRRATLPSGSWDAWVSLGPPSQGVTFADIDAVTDDAGGCELFAVASNGAAFTRSKSAAGAWGDWRNLTAGSYRSVTALNHAGTISAAMIDTAGDIWRTSRAVSGWNAPTRLGRPAGVRSWRDIDMTWDEQGRGFMLAIPTNSGNTLHFMPMYGATAWSEWRFFDTHLWAPGTAPQDSPRLQSVTAARWMEDPSGTTSPVVFATDDTGNVFFIEYARAGTPGWNLNWKSFYHESIVYK